jgi:hypothetical protein
MIFIMMYIFVHFLLKNKLTQLLHLIILSYQYVNLSPPIVLVDFERFLLSYPPVISSLLFFHLRENVARKILSFFFLQET